MADTLEKVPLKKEAVKPDIIKLEFGNEKEDEFVVKDSNEHLVLTQEFDPLKKYMYELAEHVQERTYPVILTSNAGRINIPLPQRKFPANRNIILTSQIIWKGQRRVVRYYDGCTTIFADKQPQDKETKDQLIAQTNKLRYRFIDGKFGANGFERMLLLYLNICSWNVFSPFRTPTANNVFRALDSEIMADEELSSVDAIEEALKLSKDVPLPKMKEHATKLGIALTNWDSGNELSEKEIRAKYRKEASGNPKHFIETYNS